MTTEDDLRELFASLSDERPHEADVARVVARARTVPPRRTPAVRLRRPLALAAAAAAVAVVALLPGGHRGSPIAFLDAAAATAERQPPVAPGWRYVQGVERFRYRVQSGGRVAYTGFEQPREIWTRDGWHGRVVLGEARPLPPSGDPALAAGHFQGFPPGSHSYQFGDGWLRDLSLNQLPTDPDALLAYLRRSYAASGVVGPARLRAAANGELAYNLLLLLTDTPASPELRATLFRALAKLDSVRDLGDMTDEQGRKGHGIAIGWGVAGQTTVGEYRVIVDPDTSEVLSWSVRGDRGADLEPAGTPRGEPKVPALVERTVTILRTAQVPGEGATP
jgi:hypothetical protein